MTDGMGGFIPALAGLGVLICALITGAVWMYGRQSAKRRIELKATRGKVK